MAEIDVSRRRRRSFVDNNEAYLVHTDFIARRLGTHFDRAFGESTHRSTVSSQVRVVVAQINPFVLGDGLTWDCEGVAHG
jgi:hypothetical protein